MTDPRTAQQESWNARTRAKVNDLTAREETAAETWQRGTDVDACEGWEPDAPPEAEVRYLLERLDRAEARLAAVETLAEEWEAAAQYGRAIGSRDRADVHQSSADRLRAALEGRP